MNKLLGSSPKTTALAILALVAIVVNVLTTIFSEGIGSVDWGTVLPALIVAIKGFFSRDNDVSSESAGAK